MATTLATVHPDFIGTSLNSGKTSIIDLHKKIRQTFKTPMNSIHLYTDGAARGNPGPGGYGAVLMWGNHRKELSAGFRLTTNNRMEIWAVIAGLETIKKNDFPITVFSDSQYVVNAIEKGWLKNWLRTDFSGGKKNKDLWKRYHEVAKKFNVKFVWVKGHADNPHNNRCDELATAAADGKDLAVDAGYEALV